MFIKEFFEVFQVLSVHAWVIQFKPMGSGLNIGRHGAAEEPFFWKINP